MLKSLVLIALVVGLANVRGHTTIQPDSEIEIEISEIEKQLVVPDVIDVVPPEIVNITYDSDVSVNSGNVLTPTQVKDIPTVAYYADPREFYTLVMTDPDGAYRAYPEAREWQHWLVGNIPGDNVDEGETLSAYIGSGPPQGSGFHRYTFLIFEQPEKLNFTEPLLANNSLEHRGKFSTRRFATKYELGNPVAGNFYLAEWDEYVPILYEQLSSGK